MYGTKITPENYVTPTVVEEYENDKRELDKFLEDDKHGTDRERLLAEFNEVSGDEELSKIYQLCLGIDVSNGDWGKVLGAESIPVVIKDIVKYIIRAIKNFGKWLYYFFFNKIKEARNQLQELKDDLRSYQLKPSATYPSIVIDLAYSDNVGENPIWICQQIDMLSDLFDKIVRTFKYLVDQIKPLNGEVSKPDMISEAEEILKYVSIIFTGSVPHGSKVVISDPLVLPGGKTMSFISSDFKEYNNFKMEITRAISVHGNIGKPLQPDRYVVEKSIGQMDALLDKIAKFAKVPSDFITKFEKEVVKVEKSNNYASDYNRDVAVAFYAWLQKFQSSCSDQSLTVILNGIVSAIKICEVQLEK